MGFGRLASHNISYFETVWLSLPPMRKMIHSLPRSSHQTNVQSLQKYDNGKPAAIIAVYFRLLINGGPRSQFASY